MTTKILLDDIEATSTQEVEQKLCAIALQAGVKATFTEIVPQRVYGYANAAHQVYNSHGEFDSLDDARAFTKVWLGFDAQDEYTVAKIAKTIRADFASDQPLTTTLP